MEAARRHTVTAWKPHCSEQDVPITDNEKAPFVHFIRNCMLDFSSVHGNATTSNAVQEGRFPKHYYEAAAVRVVASLTRTEDTSNIDRILGCRLDLASAGKAKQRRGRSDREQSRCREL
jgi:hypothetical protein